MRRVDFEESAGMKEKKTTHFKIESEGLKNNNDHCTKENMRKRNFTQ